MSQIVQSSSRLIPFIWYNCGEKRELNLSQAQEQINAPARSHLNQNRSSETTLIATDVARTLKQDSYMVLLITYDP
jgi:hypothetical protein